MGQGGAGWDRASAAAKRAATDVLSEGSAACLLPPHRRLRCWHSVQPRDFMCPASQDAAVLALDEATANVDRATDALIQQVWGSQL